MKTDIKNLIKKAYSAFNERDIDKALSTMQPDVQWSKAWEGGYISGHGEIKEYWTRQWKEINPIVEPVEFNDRPNGSLEILVHQLVKDLQGNSLFDGYVKHIYTFENDLIKTMDIELNTFTVAEIKQAHAKVKSGADFPAYIQEIKKMGVTSYETWVTDSHTDYFGNNNYHTASQPVYDKLKIASTSDKEKFRHYLKIHQQGETDYLTFCRHSAETGIEKWIVRLQNMTCTYYDIAGNEVLVENIPTPKLTK